MIGCGLMGAVVLTADEAGRDAALAAEKCWARFQRELRSEGELLIVRTMPLARLGTPIVGSDAR